MNKISKLAHIAKYGFILEFLRTRVAPGVEHAKVLSSLECLHVIDVGANRGQFAKIARRCFPSAKIDSFEPLMEAADRFQALFAQDPLVRLHRLAVGRRAGEAIIHISNRDDSSSLLTITPKQSELFPGTEEVATRAVEIVPLGAVMTGPEIVKPALLKIDVQGYELEVLRGCEGLWDSLQYVYVECSFVELYGEQALADEVIAYLREQGFALKGIYNLCHDKRGRAVQADFLFVKAETVR